MATNLKFRESVIKLEVKLPKALTVINQGSQKLIWSSSNDKIVTVDSKGNIIAKAKGIADIIVSTEDKTKEGSCKVYVYEKITNTALGKGINILQASNVTLDYIKKNNEVLDIHMLSAYGRVVQNSQAKRTVFEVISRNTVSDMINEFNTKNKVGYDGVFSVSAEVNYNTRKTENKTTKFIKAKGEVRIMHEYINNTNATSLQEFLTPQFKKDCLSKGPASLLSMYGSHVITHCYWGGLAEVNSMYTSTKHTNDKKLETIFKASLKGFSASSSNVSSSEKEHFISNSTTTVKTYGGKMSLTSIDEFNKKYEEWYKSLDSNMAVCGIDTFDEKANMIPIWEFVRLFSTSRAGAVKTYFEEECKKSQAKLDGLIAYTPVVTDINVMGLPNSNKGNHTEIPRSYNHAVLNIFDDRDNDRDSFAAKQDKILDANKGASGDYINIFYRTEQVSNYNDYNNKAISDIIMLKGQNAVAPRGYTKIPWDLNSGCGRKTDYAWLAYKKAGPNDLYVIDFIGGYVTSGKNLPAISGRQEWVYKWENGRKSSTIADLNEGAGGDYVRLVFHKIKRQK